MNSNASIVQRRTTRDTVARGLPIGRRPGAFTLIELLVVISIIAVLIGILFPVLGAANRAAKKTSTQSLIREVTTACDTFMVDKHQAPGRYSPRTMGQQTNTGFTTMENALLDLAVKSVPINTSGATVPMDTNSILEVGPRPALDSQNVWVDTLAFGAAGGPQYLTLKSEHLFAVQGQATPIDNYDTVGRLLKGMPDVVDSFGQPLLMWVRDPGAKLPPTTVDEFALRDANMPGKRSNFYWSSNAGYLNSGNPAAATAQLRDGLGEDPAKHYLESRLGGSMLDTKLIANLTAVLGSPAFPVTGNLSLPAQPRGGIVIMSAGPDREFFKKSYAHGSSAPEDTIAYGPRSLFPADTADDSLPPQGYTPDDSSNDDIIQSTGG